MEDPYYTPLTSSTSLINYLFVGMCIFGYANYKFKDETKRLAHILSLISSTCMSLVSCFAWGKWIFINLFPDAIDPLSLALQEYYTTTVVYRHTLVVFMAFLILDLAYGYFYYPKYLEILTGWIHHLAYIVLVGYIVFCMPENDLTHLILVKYLIFFMIEEIPTVILNLGKVFPQWRSDMAFGVTLTVFRVFLHFFMVMNLSNVDTIPAFAKFFASATFVVHLFWGAKWFNAYVTGKYDKKTKTQ